MHVDRTLTSGGETSVGEVEINHAAIRAKCEVGRENTELNLLRSQTEQMKAMIASLQTKLPRPRNKAQERR